jgi:hypothetical protein
MPMVTNRLSNLQRRVDSEGLVEQLGFSEMRESGEALNVLARESIRCVCRHLLLIE